MDSKKLAEQITAWTTYLIFSIVAIIVLALTVRAALWILAW